MQTTGQIKWSKFVHNCSKMSKSLNFVNIFGFTMRNALKISTNMPSIGSAIREIGLDI